jgi:hypothetical protein
MASISPGRTTPDIPLMIVFSRAADDDDPAADDEAFFFLASPPPTAMLAAADSLSHQPAAGCPSLTLYTTSSN